MSPMPNGIAEVTAAWMSDVTGWSVDELTATEIGAGIGVMSAVYRATLAGSNCPDTAIVKLTALDPANGFTAQILSMYKREAIFFNDLASQSPIRVPQSYHAAVSDDGAQVAIVMEDIGANRPCDQVAGMSIADAEQTIDALAKWHAQWWGKVSGLADSGAAVPLGSPIYPAVVPGLSAEGWDKIAASSSCHIPEVLLAIGPKYGDAVPRLLTQLDTAPNTLLHGDYRGDNIFFADNGSPVLLDFQIIGTGSGAYDLAYFITQSLTEADASAHEGRLFDRWKDGLIAGGVNAADLAGMWEDYRAAALFCLCYPLIASRGMDLDDARSIQLLDTMLSRMARAVDELNLAELL